MCELLLALNLYHKLSFGQLHQRNPAIVAVAEKLGRGASSVAMKLHNHFTPLRMCGLDPFWPGAIMVQVVRSEPFADGS